LSLLANSNAIETGGYQISRSVRLRASATPYFDRTPASISGNNTWTFSCWVKRGSDIGSTSTQESIMGAGDGGGAPARYDVFGFYNDTIQFATFNGSVASIYTTAVYRDPSAWYHLVCRYDDTQSTASNRVRIYVNGVLQTLNSPTYPNQNYGSNFNTTYLQRIAANTIATNRGIDGYLAEVIMVSGQSLDPSSFGQTDANTGVWVAKKYVGSYGTNGFYLNFSDNSAATSTTIGKDYSGNGNNWTPNNISVTAGSTYDSMLDVPAGNGYADGGNGRGNYCVMNPLKLHSDMRLTNGNLDVSCIGGSAYCVFGSIVMNSGSWYAEYTINTSSGNYPQAGIGDLVISPSSNQGLGDANGTAYQRDGRVIVNGSTIGTFATFTNGDVIGVAYDATNNRIYFAKNNTWINSGNPSGGTGYFSPASPTQGYVFGTSTYSVGSCSINLGQRPFTYTPPTGFKALNTTNLPDPTVKKGSSYFDINLRTGNGSTTTVTGIPFAPDLVWVKARNNVMSHNLFDRVRGAQNALYSNLTDAETSTTNLTAFTGDGYTVGNSLVLNTYTFVDWLWKANGTGVSNTAGSITSTVSANTTSGFSIATTTGTGGTGTIGHGLGAVPQFIMCFRRNTAADHYCYHQAIGNTNFLILNSTAASAASANLWNNTTPTSTVFSVGNTNNNSGDTYVHYIFAAIPGYSAFGKYTGNGSTDGPFVYCGFRPKWVLIKQTTVSSRDWIILDTSRNTYNVADLQLLPNTAEAESTTFYGSTAYLDILSNGFKIRSASGRNNESTAIYIYAAFAENPTKYANAR
jgi:hypothetical protein